MKAIDINDYIDCYIDELESDDREVWSKKDVIDILVAIKIGIKEHEEWEKELNEKD